jgi:excisionase family DNA binding protein
VLESIHWLSTDEVAERLHVSPNRVRQLIRDGHLAGSGSGHEPRIPADFLDEHGIVKGLSGTITLLRDAGYTDAELLDWLYTADESLPGTPIQALRENRGTEVKRRAQAAGF